MLHTSAPCRLLLRTLAELRAPEAQPILRQQPIETSAQLLPPPPIPIIHPLSIQPAERARPISTCTHSRSHSTHNSPLRSPTPPPPTKKLPLHGLPLSPARPLLHRTTRDPCPLFVRQVTPPGTAPSLLRLPSLLALPHRTESCIIERTAVYRRNRCAAAVRNVGRHAACPLARLHLFVFLLHSR